MHQNLAREYKFTGEKRNLKDAHVVVTAAARLSVNPSSNFRRQHWGTDECVTICVVFYVVYWRSIRIETRLRNSQLEVIVPECLF